MQYHCACLFNNMKTNHCFVICDMHSDHDEKVIITIFNNIIKFPSIEKYQSLKASEFERIFNNSHNASHTLMSLGFYLSTTTSVYNLNILISIMMIIFNFVYQHIKLRKIWYNWLSRHHKRWSTTLQNITQAEKLLQSEIDTSPTKWKTA